MMRWNSTKTYTEEDILRMQQEAVTRVHEFQTRAKTLPFYDVPESDIRQYYDPAPALQAPSNHYEPDIRLPPPPPMPEQAPDYPPAAQDESPTPPTSFGENAPPGASPAMMPTEAPPAPTDPFTGLLARLGVDGETLLIIGLMFLLYNEKADNSLLMALGYLLL